MNNLNKIIFITCICFNYTLFTHVFTPANTIIVSDIDEVLIKKCPWTIFKLLYDGLLYDPLNIITYSKGLYYTGKAYAKNAAEIKNQLWDHNGNAINGLTFHLLFHGMCNKYLTPYVQLILHSIANSRCFISGTKKIYDYLKHKKGYSIIYATNNDHIAYAISATSLGKKFTDLADYVFVAQPGNNDAVLTQFQEFAQQPQTPATYKQLLHKALTIQPTHTILHAPGKKPEYTYYHYVEQKIGPQKNIIFIDDQKENIYGFNRLQKNTVAIRYGIQFHNPQQLLQEFINVGILSEIEDKELLKEIRYPGIWGTVRLFIKQILSKIPSAATSIP